MNPQSIHIDMIFPHNLELINRLARLTLEIRDLGCFPQTTASTMNEEIKQVHIQIDLQENGYDILIQVIQLVKQIEQDHRIETVNIWYAQEPTLSLLESRIHDHHT